MNKDNLTIYNAHRSVPKEALKEIKGGRLKGMSDINPMWRIKSLTESFGMCGVGWFTEIVEQRLEQVDNEEVVALVTINLYVKSDGEWSQPIVGLGGSKLVMKEYSGMYNNDEAFKMAYTDALGIACKALGIGADVWWDADRTKYDVQANDEVKKPTTTKPKAEVKKDTDIKKPDNESHGLASEKQLKFIFSLAKQKNYTDKIKGYVELTYGKDNSAQLTSQEASEIIKYLQDMDD